MLENDGKHSLYIVHFSLKDKLQAILEATFTHSKNLASFVFIYKSLTNLMEYVQSEKSQYHSFVAAFLGGYLIWGNYNKVNEQVSVLRARVILLSGFLSLFSSPGKVRLYMYM